MAIKEHLAKRGGDDSRSEIFTARAFRAQVVGFSRVGMSLNQMASPAAYEMTRELVQVGIDLQAKLQGSHAVAADYVRAYGRSSFQQELLAAHEAESAHVLRQYAAIRFVNLKIDAGTVSKSHCTHGLVDSPVASLPPWLYDAKVNEGWTTENYVDYLNELLNEMSENAPGIAITSIVHDNLPAQSNAVHMVLQERSLGILDIPCFNHMLNLVFTHSLGENANLALGVQYALGYQRILRMIGRPAPSIPKTRWLYVVELIEYIAKFAGDATSLCEASPGLDNEIFSCSIDQVHTVLMYVQAILKPMHNMSLKLEANAARLADVIPAVLDCISEWSEAVQTLLHNNAEALSILNTITSHFFARLYSNAFRECLTAFVLSTAGRDWIQAHVDGTHSIERLINPEEDPFTMTMREMDELPQDPDAEAQVPVVSVEAGDELELVDDSFDEAAEQEGQPKTITQVRRQMFTDMLAQMSEAPALWKLSPEFMANYMQIAAETMHEFSGRKAPLEVFQMCLVSWLGGDLLEYVGAVRKLYRPTDGISFDVKFWDHLYGLAIHDVEKHPWQSFAETARIFENAACSEASVERLLSIQRHLQGTSMTNVGMDVLTAKLQMYGPDVVMPQEVHDVTPK